VFHQARGAVFIDDFAHHPTAIRETLRGARERWPGRRLWALFEPRSNTTVTNRFQRDLAEALAVADRIWLGAVHRADRIAPEERLDREAVTAALVAMGRDAHFADEPSVIVEALHADVAEGDIVLVMSNGAFGGIYEQIRQALP
jgi:UDP-N-acetylmuramate: L-alanyl-gamma-D-glutamyl-meso-diaminopimelate ligase